MKYVTISLCLLVLAGVSNADLTITSVKQGTYSKSYAWQKYCSEVVDEVKDLTSELCYDNCIGTSAEKGHYSANSSASLTSCIEQVDSCLTATAVGETYAQACTDYEKIGCAYGTSKSGIDLKFDITEDWEYCIKGLLWEDGNGDTASVIIADAVSGDILAEYITNSTVNLDECGVIGPGSYSVSILSQAYASTANNLDNCVDCHSYASGFEVCIEMCRIDTVVPAPGAVLLGMLGLGVVGMVRRRLT